MVSLIRIVFEFYPVKGGSVTHIIELSKEINPYLEKQLIIAPDFGENCKIFDENFDVPVLRVKYYPIKRIFRIPVLPLIHLLYMVNVYFQIRKMERPDLIHTHGISLGIFGIIIGKKLNVPTVGMLHGSTNAYSKISDMYETISAKLFKPIHAIILDDGSEVTSKFKKLWKNRFTIVHHGIDTNYFKYKPKNITLIEKSELTKFNFIVISTSSLIAVKNIDLTIKSFKIFLDATNSSSCLLIIGEGPLKDELTGLVMKYSLQKNIRFIGQIQIDEIIEYISIADVTVATSLYSNMNRSIQETMACEKPVVVFNSGGTNKIVRHMENGLLAYPGDINAFAENLKLLYENPELKEKLGRNARDTIIKERSWVTRIKKELEVYDNILKVKK